MGLSLPLLLESNARADPLVVNGESFLNFAIPLTSYGSSTQIKVTAGAQPSLGLVRFDLAPLPTGVSLSKVTLRLWVDSVTAGGTVKVKRFTSAWSEGTVKASSAPTNNYTGDLKAQVPGAPNGYAAAKTICETTCGPNAPEAHMCTAEEIIRTLAVDEPFLFPNGVPNAWYSTGAFGPVGMSDCTGWSVTTTQGAAWASATLSPTGVSCSSSYPVICCK